MLLLLMLLLLGCTSMPIAWNDRWHVAGLAIPLPRDRTSEAESAEPGHRERAFTCSGLVATVAAQVWDDWANVAGLRRISALGPQPLGMSRLYDGGSCAVSINLVHMPDRPARVHISLELPAERPQAELVDGAFEAWGFRVPFPANASMGVLTDFAGARGPSSIDAFVAELTPDTMLAFYGSWLASEGFVEVDRFVSSTDSQVFFADSTGFTLGLGYFAPRAPALFPTLRITFEPTEVEAAD